MWCEELDALSSAYTTYLQGRKERAGESQITHNPKKRKTKKVSDNPKTKKVSDNPKTKKLMTAVAGKLTTTATPISL
jgi:hypothetical protein